MEVNLARKGRVSKMRNVFDRIAMFKNCYKMLFPFNRMFTGVQKLRLRNGKSVYVRDIRSIDTNIVRDVLWNDEYSVEQMSLPLHAVVFDLGANIGTFCVEIKYVCPTAHITAYEPHPSNFKILTMNAPSATLIQKAATEKTGTVHLEDSKDFVGLQVIKQGGIIVESMSLDDILKDVERVDLLKIDIEGSEVSLLNAASPTTFAKVRAIVMETHEVPGFNDVEWAESILSKNGFKTSWVIPNGVVYGEKL